MTRLILTLSILCITSVASASWEWKATVQKNGLRIAKTYALAITPNGNFPATMSIECQPGPQGAISFYYTITEVNQIKDFPFDEFEGPDAPAATKKLGRIQVFSKNTKMTMHKELGGFFATPTSFAFSFSNPVGTKNEVTDMLDRLMKGAGTFSICVTAESQKQICSDFTVKGAEKVISETVKPCL